MLNRMTRRLLIILCTIVFTLISTLPVDANQDILSLDEKLNDFDHLYFIVQENYPLLWVKERHTGVNWLERKEEFRNWIEDTHTDEEFYNVIQTIVGELKNSHTHVISPQSMQGYKQMYKGTQAWGEVFTDRTDEAYTHWKKVLGTSSELSPSNTDTANLSEIPNVLTSIIEQDRIAYIRIKSFSAQFIQTDKAKVLEFLSSVKDYPYIIIDIRGNVGGAEKYWQDLLVAPLITKPIATDFYVCFRSGEYVQNFIKATLGAGYSVLRVGRNLIPRGENFPDEILTEQFTDPIKLPRIVFPKDSVGFDGEILLLVDELVYSSAEGFAAFAKATGWATLVGTQTGGDGIGISPMIFSLPNSGLLIRMPQGLGLNPNGTANEEFPTYPDVYVEYNTDEYNELENILTEQLEPGVPCPELDAILREAIRLCNDGLSNTDKDHSLGAWIMNMSSDIFSSRYGVQTTYSDYLGDEYEGKTISEVRIHGAFNTNENLIRKLVGLNSGDIYSSSVVQLVQERLNMFSVHRSITVRPIAEGDKVALVVGVEDSSGPIQSPQEIANRVISDVINQQLTYTHYNIGGRMINLTGVFGFGPTKKRTVSFEIPFVLGVPIKATFSAGTYTNSHAFTWGEHKGSSFQMDNSVIRLGLVTILKARTTLAFDLRYMNQNLTDLKSTTGLLVDDGRYLKTSIALQRYTPSQNRMVSYDSIGIIDCGTIFDLNKDQEQYEYVTASIRKNIPISEILLVVLRANCGWMDSTAPYSQQYVLGGSGGLDAYSPTLVGNRYFITGAELRRYFTNTFSCNLMLGAGYIWESNDSLTFDHPFTGVGIGLKYRTPVGLVLEAKVSKDPVRDVQRFVFGITNEF